MKQAQKISVLKYNYEDTHFNVAYAIVTGFVYEQAASEDLKTAIALFINFCQFAKEDGDIKTPG